MKHTISIFRTHSRSAIYALLIVLLAIPVLQPLGLPVLINKDTKDLYDYVSGLSPGTVIGFGNLLELTAWPELNSFGTAILRHIFSRNLKVVIFSLTVMAPRMAFRMMEPLDLKGKTYGVDYVVTAFLPGEELAIARIMENCYSVKADFYDTPIEKVPIMEKVKTGRDLALWVDIQTGRIVEGVVRQVTPFTKLTTAVIGGMVPFALPYLSSGQLTGLIRSTTRRS